MSNQDASQSQKPEAPICRDANRYLSDGWRTAVKSGKGRVRQISFAMLFLTALGSLPSCHGTKKTQETTTESEPTKPAEPTMMTVSFSSMGEGINSTAWKKLENYISQFESTHQVIINQSKRRFGMEGETHFYLNLESLDPTQRSAFITECTALLQGERLVTVVLN